MLSFWEIANVTVPPTRFQMVSLLKLAKVTEEGVRFLSPHDGTPMYDLYLPLGLILFC